MSVDVLPELMLATNNFGNTRSGSLIGPLGGFVIAALVVATVLLIRNMDARLRRLPDRFPQAEPRAESQAESQAEPGVEPRAEP